jgi:hypothetical protein
MLASGWMRLWVLLSAILLTSVAIGSAYYVWGRDVCYSFVTVSVVDTDQQQDRELADRVKNDTVTRTLCGTVQYSVLLTLETLAERGVVTQVSFQWLEPRGWSFSDYDMLDILESGEISVVEIVDRVTQYVHNARLIRAMWFLVATLSLCLAILAVGSGVAWVRKGFER